MSGRYGTALYELDAVELIEFARTYRDLGEAVQDQIDSLLDGNVANFDAEVNPNAVKLIKRELGGLNEELDGAIEAYESWFQGGNEEPGRLRGG